ncbi:MAG: S8 family peptidase, partial [Verrucomicrobiota bacterium]
MKLRSIWLVASLLIATFAVVVGFSFLKNSEPQRLLAKAAPETTEPPRSAARPVVSSQAPRPDQPESLAPQPPAASPDWVLLDWAVAPSAHSPTLETRTALYEAPGKYPYVRVEEEIQRDPVTGAITVLRTSEMVADQIIVKLREGKSREDLASLVAPFRGIPAQNPFATETWLIGLEPALEAVPEALVALHSATAAIDYAEPNFLVRSSATPNDTRYTDNSIWHLPKISAPTAWDSRTNAGNITVAVIDTGVRYTHEDLAANMWVNPGEIPGNGIDDDKNTFIDDIHGVDAFSNDSDPTDENGHGTHVAGLIGAVGNNGKGVSGVAWSGVKIMALRFIGTTGSIPDNVRCIDYAISKGAKVINASYGSSASSFTESAAINRARQAGIIMVAAAGNDGTNNDTTPFYPASYTQYFSTTLNNILAVGASDKNDNRASFSNFGNASVDIMVPGVDMWSTTNGSNSSYGSGQGTSFAAPVASGALALLRASYPNDSISQLMQKMLAGVDAVPELSSR